MVDRAEVARLKAAMRRREPLLTTQVPGAMQTAQAELVAELLVRPSLSLSQIDWLIALVERWELVSSKRRVSSDVLTTLRAMRDELTKEDDGAGA